jgi:hypothetical protein
MGGVGRPALGSPVRRWRSALGTALGTSKGQYANARAAGSVVPSGGCWSRSGSSVHQVPPSTPGITPRLNVSQRWKDLVAGSGLTFEEAGERELKGVPDLWHLYRVSE